MRITIAKKIAVPFMVVVVLLVGMSWITYQGFHKVNSAVNAMELENIKRNDAGNLRFNITRLLMPANDFIITGHNRYKNEFEYLLHIANLNLADFDQHSLTRNEKLLLIQIKNDLDSITSYSKQIFSIPEPRKSLLAAHLMEIMDYRFGKEVNKKTTLIFNGISKRVESYRIMAATIKESIMTSIFIITSLVVFISLIISYLTVKRISKSILTLQQSHKKLKESKRLTSSIVSTINAGLIVFNTENKILSANSAFYNMTNFEPGNVHSIVEILEKLEISDEGKSCILSRKFGDGLECNYLDSVKGNKILYLTFYPMPETDGESLLFLEDITKRKHDEQIVVNSEKYFRALIENSTDALVVISPEGYLLYEGKSNKSITGYEHNELLNQRILKVIHPEDLPAVNELLKNILENPKITASLEIRFLQKEGTWRWLETKWKNALNEPSVGGIIINAGDITERKRAEEELIKINTVVEQTADSVVITDRNGTIQYVNQAFTNETGYVREEAVGKTLRILKSGKHSKEFYENLWKTILAGEVFRATFINKRKDGELIYEFKTITPIKDNVGRITHFVSTARNITEQYSAQQEIISQKNKFAQLFDNSPIAIALLDAKDRVSVINESFSALFGYYIEEIEGKFLNDLIVPDELKKEAEAYSFETMTGNQVNKESYRKKKEGSLAYVQIVGVPIIVNDQSVGSYAMYMDLTNRKKIEEELIKAKEKAEEMSRLKSNFLANMNHELRTPLNGILGYSDILASMLADEELIEMAQGIHQSGKRLSETLNLILDLSEAETGKMKVIARDISILPPLKEIIESFSTEAVERNLQLKTIINAEDVWAHLDEQLFKRVLHNLIDNAIKFTEKGSVTVEVGIEKENSKNGEWFFIKIHDTGIGIPEDKIDIIWQEFRQVSEGISRNFEGPGLGLTISKKAVELMDGVITAESVQGAGSTFTIKFPTVQLKQIESPVELPDASQKLNDAGEIIPERLPQILYLEDDLTNRQIVQLYLKRRFDVHVASDAVTALEMVGKNLYDIFLIDVNLGAGMNGMEFVKELLQMPQYADVPKIAVTAYATGEDKEEFLKGGCTHYLSKPFSKQQIIDLINGIVFQKK